MRSGWTSGFGLLGQTQGLTEFLLSFTENAAKSQDVLKFQEIKYILNTLRNFSEPNFL